MNNKRKCYKTNNTRSSNLNEIFIRIYKFIFSWQEWISKIAQLWEEKWLFLVKQFKTSVHIHHTCVYIYKIDRNRRALWLVKNPCFYKSVKHRKGVFYRQYSKWRLNNYSFVFMLIILTSLVSTNKIQKNFCFKARLVRVISIKTKE